MWSQNDIGKRPQVTRRIYGCVRLAFKNVECSAGNAAVRQHVIKRSFIQNRAARGVDQPGLLPKYREAVAIDEVFVGWSRRDVKRHEIRVTHRVRILIWTSSA